MLRWMRTQATKALRSVREWPRIRRFSPRVDERPIQNVYQTLLDFIQSDETEHDRILRAHPELLGREAELLLESFLELHRQDGLTEGVKLLLHIKHVLAAYRAREMPQRN
jgi:hypothetical protein